MDHADLAGKINNITQIIKGLIVNLDISIQATDVSSNVTTMRINMTIIAYVSQAVICMRKDVPLALKTQGQIQTNQSVFVTMATLLI